MRRLGGIASDELERLASSIERGVVGVPPGETELRAEGFDVRLAGAPLEGLDRVGAARLLRAVAEDRRERVVTRLELVWTGPETRVARSRDTAVLVRELFEYAQRDVLIAGFAFDHGEEIFEPLHRAMRERGVRVEVYLDVGRVAQGDEVDEHVRAAGARFLTSNWPFGAPLPELFHDPRTSEPGSVASLHAKCIVVDLERALVTSANFTDRGQSRNIELGVLIEDAPFAARIAGQWRSLVASGALARVG
jgi:phosphatidylserine/phosphatidylglycerophosphate/cardiolipin synthase-like enzyme